MTKTILITGGTGWIASKLTQSLLRRGDRVVLLSRSLKKSTQTNLILEHLDISQEMLPEKYDGQLDGIVHLAGEPIFGRWTEAFKKKIYDSRVQSTRHIVESISSWKQKPSVMITASAFGFYGDCAGAEINERAPTGNDFLAHVCSDWEHAAQQTDIRNVQIRTPHILGQGGFLAPLLPLFHRGLGAWIGHGNGYLPWVHIDDIVSIYLFALDHTEVSGSLNASAPEQVTQKELMRCLGAAMRRPVFFSIPIFLLRMRYGELANTFDYSVRLSVKKLLDLGYVFQYPKLQPALEAIVQK